MGNKTNGEAVRFDIAKMNELLRPFGIKVGEIVDNTKALDTRLLAHDRRCYLLPIGAPSTKCLRKPCF